MSKYCTSIYLCFLLLVFPLYYQNNYINILEAKTSLFTIVTVIYFLAMLICFWIESIQRYEDEQKKNGKGKKRKRLENHVEKRGKTSWQNIFLISFVVVLLISMIATGDFGNAWIAPNTKLFGTKILLLCCGLYYFTSKGFVPGKAVKGSLILGLTIVSVLTILNRYNIDPLKMYSNLIEEQWPIYLSTIGNINILSNYFCVFLPLVIGLFLYAKDIIGKVIYAFLVFLGVMAGISTNSDSFFLGFGAALLVFLWFSLESRARTLEYIKVCILCAAAMLVLAVMTSASTFDVPWERVQKMLLEDMPWLIVTIGFILLWCIVRRMYLPDSLYHKIRVVLFAALGIGAVFFAGYIMKVNIFGGEDVSEMLIFDDKWGTNRGYVWKNSLLLFGELPFYHKLVGIGPGMFHEFFAVPNEIRTKPFVDPHSDYLFYLVTTGILGFVSYFGLMISTIVTCLKKVQPQSIVLVAILFAWLAQATVNTSLVFTAPYLFILLGLSRWIENEKI